MRTRFKKVWCGSCGSMQFAGECPHGRIVAARPVNQFAAAFAERLHPDVMHRRLVERAMRNPDLQIDEKALEAMGWKRYA